MSSDNHAQEKEQAARRVALGAEIAARRKRAGFTQEKFAEALGKKPGVVSAWENGKSLPDLGNFLDVCALLKVSPDEMLSAAGIPAGGTPARSVQPLSPKSSLTAPERAMEDATFRRAWKIVGRLWLTAKAAKFKPDHPATKRWKRIAGMLDEFEHVGETPEPDAGEPWPAAGHPLHR